MHIIKFGTLVFSSDPIKTSLISSANIADKHFQCRGQYIEFEFMCIWLLNCIVEAGSTYEILVC